MFPIRQVSTLMLGWTLQQHGLSARRHISLTIQHREIQWHWSTERHRLFDCCLGVYVFKTSHLLKTSDHGSPKDWTSIPLQAILLMTCVMDLKHHGMKCMVNSFKPESAVCLTGYGRFSFKMWQLFLPVLLPFKPSNCLQN